MSANESTPVRLTDCSPLFIDSIDSQGVEHVGKIAYDLAASMKADGQVQPIVVRPVGPGRYRLVAGLRRLDAARALGWTTIFAVVDASISSDEDATFLRGVENAFRAKLSKAERVLVYRRWLARHELARGCTDRQAAAKRHAKANGRTRGGTFAKASRSVARIEKAGATIPGDGAAEVEDRGFNTIIRAVSGDSERTAYRYTALARCLSDREAEALAKARANDPDIKSLINLKDPEARERAVAMIEGGSTVREAVNLAASARPSYNGPGAATLKRDRFSTVDRVLSGVLDEARPGDGATSLKRTVDRPEHVDPAVEFYKAVEGGLVALRSAMKNHSGKIARAGRDGNPLALALAKVLGFAHPRKWRACWSCTEGRDSSGDRCRACNGLGFRMTERGRKATVGV